MWQPDLYPTGVRSFTSSHCAPGTPRYAAFDSFSPADYSRFPHRKRWNLRPGCGQPRRYVDFTPGVANACSLRQARKRCRRLYRCRRDRASGFPLPRLVAVQREDVFCVRLFSPARDVHSCGGWLLTLHGNIYRTRLTCGGCAGEGTECNTHGGTRACAYTGSDDSVLR